MNYDLILVLNRYLVSSRNRNSRHDVIKYLSMKISDLISKRSNNRSVNSYLSSNNRVNIWQVVK